MDNSIFEGKRRDNISKICSNCEVLPVRDGCLKILTEPVEVCFDRAKKLQVLNQYAEESECATFEALEEKTCGLLRWDEKEVETHRKEISLLTSTQLFDPKNEMIDNESINRVFYEICGSRFPVEDFKDYCKKERTCLLYTSCSTFIIPPRWMLHGNSKTSFFPVWRCKDSAIWFAWNTGCPLLHRSRIGSARKELFIPRNVLNVTNYVMRLMRC